MGLEFDALWALLLLPVCAGLALWIDKRYRRRIRSLKSRVALGVRLALITLLMLAISAPSILLFNDVGVTWVLMDASDSTASIRAGLEAHLQEEMARLPEKESVGVISFGGNAMVEMPLTEAPSFAGIHTAVSADASRLTEGLRLAGALLPAESTGRILVVSDGKTDDASALAAGLAQRGIAVDVLQAPAQEVPDAQVTEVSVPEAVFEGNAFAIQVTVDSTISTRGTLVLYQNGVPGATREVEIRKGENLFVFQDVAEKTGLVTYEAQLQAEGDGQSQNNKASAYLYAAGAPTVLLVEGAPGGAEELAKMLAAAGMQTERILPEAMPDTAEAFRRYDAIVLGNVEVESAKEQQWLALEAAVRVLGRGLCVFGGDRSYALGGYQGTTLETMLPVTIDVRNKLQMPALSLMLVIDKSGSMTDGAFGITRLEVAKEAAMRSTEVLTAKDQVGVIAFDDAAKWVVPLQPVTDVGAIQSLIGTIRPGGGTAFYNALNMAVAALETANTPQKHIIFLSDGEPGDSGFERLAMQASMSKITLTTVAVGSGANTRLMELLSTIGGGRSYAAGEFDNIPHIFTKETFLAGGTYVQNREFTPIITEASALTDFSGFPKLAGYLSALEKPMATVSMVSDRSDPLLAWWPYGAGNVLAWTSDTEGAWTKSFLEWTDAAAFFGGLVEKTLPREARDGGLMVKEENGTAHVVYTLPEQATTVDMSEELLQTVATVLSPDGVQEEFSLTQTGVDTYEGSFSAMEQGAYTLRVEQKQAGEIVRVKEGGTVVSFAEEYDLRQQAAAGGLEALANATGGRVLQDGDEWFLRQPRGTQARRPLSTLLCVIAMLLWLLDIVLRRVDWEPLVLKWLQKKQLEDAAAGESAAQPVKAKPKKEKQRKSAEKASPTETTDRLLEIKRQRKKL